MFTPSCLTHWVISAGFAADAMSFPTEDRVSALPDSILSHILSFLPTKSSAATSILSKRWNPLWLSVLDLNFDAQSFKDFITFRHVVSSVILSREVTLPIRSFCLRYSHDHGYDDNDMNRFINAVLKRGIENLDLHFSRKINQLKLTSNIFSCKTLTVLKLKNLYMNKLPASQLHFPLLKILIMDWVYFMCFEDVTKFVLACPILEDLQTCHLLFVRYSKNFSCDSDIVKGKCLPNLIRARISENISIPLTLLSSVHTLNVQLRCPCLPPPYIAHTFHNLTQMELFFFNYKGNIWTGKWMWMQQVLQHSSNLQHLTIHQEIENGVNEAYWEDPQIVPQCLSSQLKTFSFRGCRGKNSELQFVEYIMQNSKVLRTMTIHTASSIDLKPKHQMLIKLTVCPRNHKLIFY